MNIICKYIWVFVVEKYIYTFSVIYYIVNLIAAARVFIASCRFVLNIVCTYYTFHHTKILWSIIYTFRYNSPNSRCFAEFLPHAVHDNSIVLQNRTNEIALSTHLSHILEFALILYIIKREIYNSNKTKPRKTKTVLRWDLCLKGSSLLFVLFVHNKKKSFPDIDLFIGCCFFVWFYKKVIKILGSLQ